jgi:hypothetical protein
MLNADLGLRDQAMLLFLIAAILVAILARLVVFYRLERAHAAPQFPQSWSIAQRETLQRIRLYIGLGLVWFWAIYCVARPSFPTNWPFSYAEALSLIALTAMSYAWVLLLVPRNLQRLDSLPRSFAVFLAVLIAWWGAAFCLVVWMLTRATNSPALHLVPNNIA